MFILNYVHLESMRNKNQRLRANETASKRNGRLESMRNNAKQLRLNETS